jgi:hypothetical protein
VPCWLITDKSQLDEDTTVGRDLAQVAAINLAAWIMLQAQKGRISELEVRYRARNVMENYGVASGIVARLDGEHLLTI